MLQCECGNPTGFYILQHLHAWTSRYRPKLFRGPGYFGVDMSVVKKFGLPNLRIWGEGASIELRGNFFNVFNKLNLQPFSFGTANTTIEDPLFGRWPAGVA